MQPRDFEDDLASSAERFAKKKKKLEMDRLKSTETTPCNSPLLGAVLVEDTQPRGSPFPVYIYPQVIKSFLTYKCKAVIVGRLMNVYGALELLK